MSSDPDDDDDDFDAPTGPRPMTPVAATGWALVALVLFLGILAILAGVRSADVDIVSQVACQAVAYLITLFLVLRVHAPNTGVRDLVGLRPTSVLFYPIAVLLGLAAQAPADRLYTAIEHRWPSHVTDTLTELFWAASFPKRAAMALAIILIGPALEEILFRGALFRPMLKNHSGWLVIGVSAVLFALAHPLRQEWLPVFLLGLVLGYVRLASGSLVTSTLVHASFNAVAFYTMAAHHPGTPEITFPRWFVAASALTVLALVALTRRVARRGTARLAREFDRQ
jgi:membrane protease YdiL (CAAX protease family)